MFMRLIAPLFFILISLIVLMSPITDPLIFNWFHDDVEKKRLYLIGALILIAFISCLVTLLIATFMLKKWMVKLRSTIKNPQLPLSDMKLPQEFLPVINEVHDQLRNKIEDSLDVIKIEWSAQTLKHLLEEELPQAEVIVVSNREPYIHNKSASGDIVLQNPASGMVTALEPIISACGGTWIAHGSGSADKETVDAHDCVAVPPDNPEYILRRVWLTQEEEEGYYYGFANEGMWPLCHITFVRPVFRESDWQAYKTVNQKFCDAVIKQAKTKNPVVLVQDYHFALLPQLIHDVLPEATVLTFWHIPWPNPEMFSICPWRKEILSGLLGSSILGFHTQFHCNNFMDSVDRFLESHINRDQSIVTVANNNTLIRPYPISIAWPPKGLAKVPPTHICRKNIQERFNLKENMLIGIGIERFDYTKGLVDRCLAVRELLIQYPQWKEQFVFIQVVAPTRSQLPTYQAIKQEVIETVDNINEELGTAHYQPIILVVRHHEPNEVFELFKAADVCIVSSLHDGMNLVAKEFVASRDEEDGVLLLSTFAGASKELVEAILVNPYDIRGTAESLQRALTMPKTEQKDRMRLLRSMVKDNNVYYWAARILFDAAYMRKRVGIEQLEPASVKQPA